MKEIIYFILNNMKEKLTLFHTSTYLNDKYDLIIVDM